jgi:DNA primase
MEAAWGSYTSAGLHARGVAYLRSRAIDVGALEAYTGRSEVEAAPGGRDNLVRYLRDAGFSDDELVDAGLAHRAARSAPVTDFFRSRVLVPVRTSEGRMAGFVGRNVGEARWAKYKNSPRTVLYDKSVNLYQPLPLPAEAQGRVVVVEGTLDAMAIAAAAIKAGTERYTPVTQSGKELSPLQVASLSSTGKATLVLALDRDAAGSDARRRLAGALRSAGRSAAEANLPDGEDPASWLALHGAAGLGAF